MKHEAGQENQFFFTKSEEDFFEESSAETLLQRLDDLCDLEYIQGEAETLHTVFPENSIDVIISVESSSCYGDLEAFYKSNYLMLKDPSSEPGLEDKTGLFLYADYFDKDKLKEIKAMLGKYYNFVKEENITPNVLHAYTIDGKERNARISRSVSCIMRPFCTRSKLNVFGPSILANPRLQEDFEQKKKIYYAFALQKKESVLEEQKQQES